MKNLKDVLEKLSIDSISEKLSIDSIVLTNKEFPINGTLEEIIEFLECNGFNSVVRGVGGVADMFNEYKSKCFYKKEDHLWFGDTKKEKISKDNPIFYISRIPDIFDVYYRDNSSWIINIVENDKKAFLKELNKRFGW